MEASCGESGDTGCDQRGALGSAHVESESDEVTSGSQSEDHVSQLGNGGEREDLLDVHVVERHCGGEDCGDSSDDTDEEHDLGVLDEQRVSPGDQVDSGLDHCRGVDQRGDGCGTGHRIGQPVVQGELSALTDDSTEDEEHTERQHVGVGSRDVGGVEHCGVIEALELAQQDEQTGHQAHVSETGDQEGLLGCGCRVGGGSVSIVVPEGPESDKQVGAQSHDLPEDEHLQEVAGDDQSEHSGQEQGDLGVVPRPPGSLLSHVSDGVHEDQGGDERGEQHHHAGEAVHVVSEVHRDVADREPLDGLGHGVGVLVAGEVLVGDQRGDDERDECSRYCDVSAFLGRFPAGEADDQETEHRDEGHQICVFYEHPYHLIDVSSASSRSLVFLILYALSSMAIPTATSAAATEMVMTTKA